MISNRIWNGRDDDSTNNESEKNGAKDIEALERIKMLRSPSCCKHRSLHADMPQRSRGMAICPRFSGLRVKSNGFLLAEALLALMIAVLCGFLLLTSLASYRNVLKKGVPVRIEERIPGQTPYV